MGVKRAHLRRINDGQHRAMYEEMNHRGKKRTHGCFVLVKIENEPHFGYPAIATTPCAKGGSRIYMPRGHARFVPKFWRDMSCFAFDVAVAVDVEDSCLLDSTSETNSERAVMEARLLQLPTSIILNLSRLESCSDRAAAKIPSNSSMSNSHNGSSHHNKRCAVLSRRELYITS
jgi:hypothetical protein